MSWGISVPLPVPQNVYEGTGGYSSSGTNTNDIANSIAFYIPLIEAGECEIITFAYVLSMMTWKKPWMPLPHLTYQLIARSFLQEILLITVTRLIPCTWRSWVGKTIYGNGAPTYLDVDTGHSEFCFTGNTNPIANGVGLCGEVTLEVTLLVDTTVAISDAGDDEPICMGSETTLNGDGGPLDDLYLLVPATGLEDPEYCQRSQVLPPQPPIP